MNKSNGSPHGPTPERTTPRRSVADLFDDVGTFARLQAKLVKLEVRQGVQRATRSLVAVVCAACVALGCAPVLLFSAAHFLADATSLSLAVALLIAAVAGLALAAVLAIGGVKGLRRSLRLTETQEEFARNVAWFQSLLRQQHSPPTERPNSKSGRAPSPSESTTTTYSD